MKLIDKLHDEHRQIRTHLRRIELNDDVELLEDHFNDLKKVLLEHLIREDNHLYPVLRNLEATKMISDSFEEEMGIISSEVMEFYAKYKSDFKGENFQSDAHTIIDRLVYRITKEERELYPIFRRYFPDR